MASCVSFLALEVAYFQFSWNPRDPSVGALLIGLCAVLYVLISLEAYSLLIGSLLLFAALAGVMYATRRIDWGGRAEAAA